MYWIKFDLPLLKLTTEDETDNIIKILWEIMLQDCS